VRFTEKDICGEEGSDIRVKTDDASLREGQRKKISKNLNIVLK
jgi:hypothetical protein